MKELLIVSYKLDTSFYELLTGRTSLGITIAVTILADIAAFMFGEWFSCKRLWTHGTDKALRVVRIAVMLHWGGLNGLFTLDTNLKEYNNQWYFTKFERSFPPAQVRGQSCLGLFKLMTLPVKDGSSGQLKCEWLNSIHIQRLTG